MTASFSKILTRKGPVRKVNNNPQAEGAKATIRRNVLNVIGADNASVLDAFAGEGILYRAVWKDAVNYVGCDVKWYRDERLFYVVDNKRLLRTLDLQQFNIFDFDAYGSPWDHVWILSARRRVAPGEKIGLVLTEGSGLNIKMGELPHTLARIAGLNPRLAGAARERERDEIMNRALLGAARMLGCRLIGRWDAHGKTGSVMRYIGVVLQGQGDT